MSVLLILGCCLWSSPVEAGTIEVEFSDQNVRYTLFTLYDGQGEFVRLDKVVDMFGLSQEIDPIDGHVTLSFDQKTASFFPGQDTVIADRRTRFLDVAPIKIDGVIMIPLQFLTDVVALIYKDDIRWDSGKRMLFVGIQDLKISGLYSSPYGEYTRIVIEMNQVVSYKITEKLPSLLILQLPHSTFQLAQNPLQIDSRSVKHVKVVDSFGTTQVIIRLGSEFTRYVHRVTEDPPRLLIDVYHTQETLVDTQISEDIVEEDISSQPEPVLPATSKQFLLRTVVIDPGHGGSDQGITISPGTEGTPDVFEKDLTLQIAKSLQHSLTQRGIRRVILTRESDEFVSPENRATVANSNRADVFISLHINKSFSTVPSGFEVYTMDFGSLELPEGYNEVSAQSQLLDYAQAKYCDFSEQLAQQIITAYQQRNEGSPAFLRRAPLFTLKGVTMPAVHIEVGYGSNEQDRIKITQEAFQQVIVAAITDGIDSFKREQAQ